MELPSVDVILDNLDSNPKCSHGPTLLFKRVSKGKEQKFYACSACRDRKDCAFYLRFEEKWTPQKESTWKLRMQDALPKINHYKLSERHQEVCKLSPEDRAFCHSCNALLLPSEWKTHSSHEVLFKIPNDKLIHPSEIMKPFENSKKEAQYLFSKKSVNAIVNMLRAAGIRRVLCVGCPRIHEYVCSEFCGDMSSMLLDFDHRYHQFFEDSKFVWFNAFNCHWFAGEKGRADTLKFMQEGEAQELAIITDPPFGGRVEPLLLTFQRLDEIHKNIHPQWDNHLPLMWIFPYFMESTLIGNYSKLTMLDYKVEYDNHPLFHQGIKGRKYGSPVRIFTNISAAKLPLPEEDGYWFCEICKRWSSLENRHCQKCRSCTSKNGCMYVHCDKCMRCVKPSWKHCNTCKRCCMQDHKCGDIKPSVCFVCNQPDHKKRECPIRVNSEDEYCANRKRNIQKRSKSERKGLFKLQNRRNNLKPKVSSQSELNDTPQMKRIKLAG